MILIQFTITSKTKVCCQFLPDVEDVLLTLINEGKFTEWPLDEEEEYIAQSAFLACLNTGPNFDKFLHKTLEKIDFDENLVEDILAFTTYPWHFISQETRLMLDRILINRSAVVIRNSAM